MDVTMVLPDNRLLTGPYEGYGVIDGIDIYALHALDYDIDATRALAAQSNQGDSEAGERFQKLRSAAIDVDSKGGPNMGGCGFKLMRTSEYLPTMTYASLSTSYTCRAQGAVSQRDRSTDPRFCEEEPTVDFAGAMFLFVKHPNIAFHLARFGYTAEWGHNSTITAPKRIRWGRRYVNAVHVRVASKEEADKLFVAVMERDIKIKRQTIPLESR